MLPTYKGLDFDLGQILLTDLAPRAAWHPLMLGEGRGDGCRGTGETPPLYSAESPQPAPRGGHRGGSGTDSVVCPPYCWMGWHGWEGLSLCWWHGEQGCRKPTLKGCVDYQ